MYLQEKEEKPKTLKKSYFACEGWICKTVNFLSTFCLQLKNTGTKLNFLLSVKPENTMLNKTIESQMVIPLELLQQW